MSGRQEAERDATVAAALTAIGGDVIRLMHVLSVEGATSGRKVAVLDWTGDGTVAVRARMAVACSPAAGDEVLVIMVGRTPVVVCATGGPLPPPPVVVTIPPLPIT